MYTLLAILRRHLLVGEQQQLVNKNKKKLHTGRTERMTEPGSENRSRLSLL
jgi:hypothetical protein